MVSIRRILFVAFLGLTLAFAGCTSQQGDSGPYGADGGAGGTDGGTADGQATIAANVTMRSSEFHPAQLTVDAGDTVRWTNEDSYQHTVTIRKANTSQRLKDTTVEAGGSTTFTFEEAGSYDVWCRFHGKPNSEMHMDVQVS